LQPYLDGHVKHRWKTNALPLVSYLCLKFSRPRPFDVSSGGPRMTPRRLDVCWIFSMVKAGVFTCIVLLRQRDERPLLRPAVEVDHPQEPPPKQYWVHLVSEI
jgi:hypothetical protein